MKGAVLAAATDTTRIIIDLESRIRNLERTLKGLDAIKKRLDAIATVKTGSQATEKAALAAQKLQQQQQKLSIQAQELANRQEKAQRATDRLTQSRQRLTAQERQNERIRAAASKRQEVEDRRQKTAAEALQRQRSTALIQQFKEQERIRASAITLDQTLGRIGGSLRNLGLGLTSLGASLSVALTAPLTALGVLATRNAVTLDSLQRGLTAITGSAEEAGRQLTRLTEIAKLPGIGFQEAIQGSIRLQAVGFSAEKAEKALVQFSNAIALTGGGREELDRITVQLGQLSAKGKVLSQDLKPIIEAGPAVGRALKEAFGTVNAEDIQALGLSSEEFLDKLLNQLGKLPRAAAGLRNTFDNFTDAVFRATASIGQAILPVLTRFIEFAEPAITKLAAAFKELPAPLQTLVVLFGGLVAAAGPALFIIGQFSTGIGGLLSALARLHTLGLLPTIAGFQLLGKVMQGTASLAAGQAATTAAAAAGWAALGGAVTAAIAVLGIATVAIISYVNSQKEAVKIGKEQIAATEAQIETLEDQIKFVNSLGKGVERTADEQERLTEIYASLNTQAKIRLTTISDEEKRLAALREELQRLLVLRESERIQQAANLTASLANTAAQIDANQRSRDSIADRVRVNTELAKSIQQSGKVTVEQSRQLERLGLSGAATAEQAIFDLNRENERLIGNQSDLIKSSKELNGTAEEQATAIRVLQQQTGLSAKELLSAAKAMGVFKGDVEATLPSIERYIKLQHEAADANEDFRRSLNKAGDDLIRSGDRAEATAQRRKKIIDAAVTRNRELFVTLKGAVKGFRQDIEAIPELRAALQREAELTGKTIEQLTTEAFTKGFDKGGTTLRNAREQLAAAILDVQQAQAEQEIANQKAGNEALLQANELSYKLQLRSYREYLEARASFTDANLALESKAAGKAVELARKHELDLRKAAAKPGLPEAERTKRLAQAERANEEAIKAETRLAEIEQQRADIAAELKQSLAEAAVQQLKDVRQLEVEYGELTGRIQAALDTAVIERFREALTQLSQAQKFLNEQLNKARAEGDKDRQVEIKKAQALNQRQIELTENIVRQELATNQLATANELVRQQKEKLADLEQQIGFEVEFRGLKEEDAIRKRLEGERKLRDSLTDIRNLIQAEVDILNAEGVKPPQALLDFIRDTNAAIRGLGELPFSEQFRLAEKEFNRINDERVRKIQDVERAVRNRTIAEVEGQILIRRINNEYTADLEAQLVLLKQIADASGQDELKRRADDAGEVVKDTRDHIRDLSKEIEAAGKDAFRSGLADFFNDLANRTATAKEAFLSFLNTITSAINDVIAQELSKRLFESIFGGEAEGSGILNAIRRLFGGGGGATVGEAAAHTTDIAEHTAAATALTTGATAAATALTTAGVTAGTTWLTSVTTSATAFAAQVAAAGAAFAAAAAAASATQAAGGLGSVLGGAGETGLFPAVPGGVYRIVEGGYPEAVITTDPRHAARQVNILRELIQRTRGFYGRIPTPDLATGGIVSRVDAEANLLNSISRPAMLAPHLPDAAMETATARQLMNLRIVNQVNAQDLVRPYLNSEAGVRDIMNVVSRNSNEIARRIPFRRGN